MKINFTILTVLMVIIAIVCLALALLHGTFIMYLLSAVMFTCGYFDVRFNVQERKDNTRQPKFA
jgi:uncharacterized membrane protein HdeD (DUF308 family)